MSCLYCGDPEARGTRCPKKEPGTFDPAERAREKQASRDVDAQALADGTKTREQLRRENSAFAFPRDRVRLTPPKREK